MQHDTAIEELADLEAVAIAAAKRLAHHRREAWHVVEWAGVQCLSDDGDWIGFWQHQDGALIIYTALPGEAPCEG